MGEPEPVGARRGDQAPQSHGDHAYSVGPIAWQPTSMLTSLCGRAGAADVNLPAAPVAALFEALPRGHVRVGR
jgi:hypothetical protein